VSFCLETASTAVTWMHVSSGEIGSPEHLTGNKSALVRKGLLIHRKRHLASYRIIRHCETIPAFTKSVPLISSSAPISGYSE